MSFSSDVKKEISRVSEPKKCCMLAEISGFLRFCGTIVLAGGGKYGIKLTTEDPAIARRMVKRLKDYFGATSTLHVGNDAPLKRGRVYELLISPDEGSEMILRETGILLVREGSNVFSEEVPDGIVKKKCDKKSFLRGAFLGSGTVSKPESGYHLELSCESENLADDVKRILNSLGLKAKVSKRRNRHVIFIKKAEEICDFLSLVGADASRLYYENVRIVRDAKNKTNRISNFDNANMNRSAENAAKQLLSIRTLAEKTDLETLKPALRTAARLRLENPGASLGELAAMADPPISKSGMNSRLKKLEELAAKLNNA